MNTDPLCWTVGLPASYFLFCPLIPWKLYVKGRPGSKQSTTASKSASSSQIPESLVSRTLDPYKDPADRDPATYSEAAGWMSVLTRKNIPDVYKQLHQHTQGSKHSEKT